MTDKLKKSKALRNWSVTEFDNFTDADKADRKYYNSLSGDERLEIMLAIMGPTYEAYPGFERVYRLIERKRG